MPYPKIELEESETLSDTERGANGFGSSDEEIKETDKPA